MTATPRTQALWMKHHAFSTEEEASEALCDFRDHGNTLETELARLRAEIAVAENWVSHHSKHADDLIAETVKLSAVLERFTGDGLLDCHAICDQRDAAVARAERAEAMLAEWSVLNLWGGTPEIIHEFIKGQQNRIHHCQDLEAELAEAVDGEINGGSIPDTLLVIHVPRSPVGYRVGQPVKVILPAIDAAMKP